MTDFNQPTVRAEQTADGFRVTGPEHGHCDKCGLPVKAANDAVMLDLILSGGASIGLVVADARHLLPEGTCPGSPSRAQYLPGRPRDPRYPYDPDYEGSVRRAYEKMQEEFS